MAGVGCAFTFSLLCQILEMKKGFFGSKDCLHWASL